MLCLSSELKELHPCWEAGREGWQLLAGVCAGGAVCGGVTALCWCWSPRPAPPGQGYLEGLHWCSFLLWMTCLRQQQPGSHRVDVVKELLQELGFVWPKQRLWTAGGHWGVPGTAAPQWILPGWADPSLCSRDTSQSLRGGGPTTAGCSCRSFVWY